MTNASDLPNEVLSIIFRQLPPKDLKNVLKTSKNFYQSAFGMNMKHIHIVLTPTLTVTASNSKSKSKKWNKGIDGYHSHIAPPDLYNDKEHMTLITKEDSILNILSLIAIPRFGSKVKSFTVEIYGEPAKTLNQRFVTELRGYNQGIMKKLSKRKLYSTLINLTHLSLPVQLIPDRDVPQFRELKSFHLNSSIISSRKSYDDPMGAIELYDETQHHRYDDKLHESLRTGSRVPHLLNKMKQRHLPTFEVMVQIALKFFQFIKIISGASVTGFYINGFEHLHQYVNLINRDTAHIIERLLNTDISSVFQDVERLKQKFINGGFEKIGFHHVEQTSVRGSMLTGSRFLKIFSGIYDDIPKPVKVGKVSSHYTRDHLRNQFDLITYLLAGGHQVPYEDDEFLFMETEFEVMNGIVDQSCLDSCVFTNKCKTGGHETRGTCGKLFR